MMTKHNFINKKVIVFFLLIIILICTFILRNKKNESSKNEMHFKNGNKSIYVQGLHKIHILDYNNFKKIKTIPINNVWDMTSSKNGDVFAIQANAEKGFKEVIVIHKAKIIKKIPVTYDWLDQIEYNKHNNKIYINQTSKITYANENCITIIDPESYSEEKN